MGCICTSLFGNEREDASAADQPAIAQGAPLADQQSVARSASDTGHRAVAQGGFATDPPGVAHVGSSIGREATAGGPISLTTCSSGSFCVSADWWHFSDILGSICSSLFGSETEDASASQQGSPHQGPRTDQWPLARSGCSGDQRPVAEGESFDQEAVVNNEVRTDGVFDVSIATATPSKGDCCDVDVSPINAAQAAVDALLSQNHVDVWVEDDYQKVRKIQRATANQGRVLLMRSCRFGGSFVAVKRMPNDWVATDHIEFARRHPTSWENPWRDIGVTSYLHREGYPHICEPLGVFRSSSSTYVVSALAKFGDLMMCLSSDALFPMPSPKREAAIWPLVHQVLIAMRRLHQFGIAHRDLSPENIVLTEGEDGLLEARLIDFGMATFGSSASGAHGKSGFEAPEMHMPGPYDAFLTDVFALGVVTFAIATSMYPWHSTRPGQCEIFAFVQDKGLRSEVARRPTSADAPLMLADVISPHMLTLLEGFLALNPAERLTVDQACQEAAGEQEMDSRAVWLRQPPTAGGISPFSVPAHVHSR